MWHVVGLQRSIREWAMRQGWGGRPVRIEQAQGILVAALGVLAGGTGTAKADDYGRDIPISTFLFVSDIVGCVRVTGHGAAARVDRC
jgi:hypothetical protein